MCSPPQPNLTKTTSGSCLPFPEQRMLTEVFSRQPGTQRRERQGPGWVDSEEGTA
jgi:hypothetical protein